MNLKDLLSAKSLIAGAAVAAGGVGAVFLAPYVAGKATDTTNIKNWWAPGAVALLGGAALAAFGGSSKPALFAGVAMAGTGAGVLALSYTAKKATDDAAAKGQLASGILSATPVAPGALPRFIYNSGRGGSYSSQGGFTPWSGVPTYSQRWAQRGGMPTRSGVMPQ